MTEKKSAGVDLPITRDRLYDLVWSEPMLRVAERFEVSSSYMARVCKELDVPRPPRGYWAKLAAGKKTHQPPLHDPPPGTPLQWSKDGQGGGYFNPLPTPPKVAPRRKKSPKTNETKNQLLNGAKEHFLSGRLSHEGDYLIPAKKLLVDFVVSKRGLEPALSLSTALFNEFEKRGHRVVIAPHGENLYRAVLEGSDMPNSRCSYNNLWSPMRCTVVYIGTVAIGLTFIEIAEEAEVVRQGAKYVRVDELATTARRRNSYRQNFTFTKTFSTGRMCLQAYSPYQNTKWIEKWTEKKSGSLEKKVKSIVRTLEKAAVTISQQVKIAREQAEIEHKRWQEEMKKWEILREKERVAKAIADSRQDLHETISKWAEAKRIEQFFQDVESSASLLDEREKEFLFERIRYARDLIGTTDALKYFLNWKAPEER